MITEKDRDSCTNRESYFQYLIYAVSDSNLPSKVMMEVVDVLIHVKHQYTNEKTPEEIVNLMTYGEKGNRIYTSRMRPCPFCGCEMCLEEFMYSGAKVILYEPTPVSRHKKGCQLEYMWRNFRDQSSDIDEAIEKWNQRAEQ